MRMGDGDQPRLALGPEIKTLAAINGPSLIFPA